MNYKKKHIYVFNQNKLENYNYDPTLLMHLNYNEQIIILNFIKTLSSKYNWDFNILYKNLPDLDFKPMKRFHKSLGARAFYNCKENTIYFEDANSISHELFHVSTYVKQDNIGFCGFEQYNNKRIFNKTFGNGFNEYLTMLLDSMVFNTNYDDFREISLAYNILLIVEDVVNLYNQLDLNSLINKLAIYSSYKESIEFFSKLDYIYTYLFVYYKKNIECVKLLYETFLYTFKCYINSLSIKYQNGLIKSDVANKKIEDMILSTPSYIKIDKSVLDIPYIDDLKEHIPRIDKLNSNDNKRYKLKL